MIDADLLLALDTSKLDPYDFRVLLHLIYRAGDRPEGSAEIARVTNISQRRVVTALQNLEVRRFITVKRETRDMESFRASTITVNAPYYWITE